MRMLYRRLIKGEVKIIGYEDESICLEYMGVKSWYRGNKLHRINGPAVEGNNSSYWFRDGQMHGSHGPAVEYSNGKKEWWHEGQRQVKL